LGPTDSLKIFLTATEAGTGKQPNQAFLLLRDRKSGLETTFPFSVKDSGKAKVDFVRISSHIPTNEADVMPKTQKDLPIQLLSAEENLQATLIIASFGSSRPYSNHVFDLEVKHDPNLPKPKYQKPLRYGKLEEIHHIFKADPKSGPMIISIVFALAVLATVPVLLGTVCSFPVNMAETCYLTNFSGHLLEQMSPISQMPYQRRHFRMACSLARLYQWKESSFCTTTTGHCSRYYLLLGS
jgi:oligosaccharyltransferase complex subunit delta (ribophorin II)